MSPKNVGLGLHIGQTAYAAAALLAMSSWLLVVCWSLSRPGQQLRRSASPGKRLQERLHCFCGDRLHQVLVEARFDCTQPILLLPPAGDCNQDRATSPGSGANLLGELVTVDVRKPNVEQHCVRTERSRELEPLPPGVCRLNVMPGRLQ